MDKLSGLASKFTEKKAEGENPTPGSHGQEGSSDSSQKDYLDKAVEKAEEKFGGGKVDPEKMRETNEKITDTAREKFEGMTGREVPEKFSN
ncbi:hypothetical protein PHISP_06386 [Aspergillus sp. HF37]|nr:hypothetical protein PHISP_06386 [Aspergillus sp. HF37]